MTKQRVAGIDLGSSAIKVVVLDGDAGLVDRFRMDTTLILHRDIEQVQQKLGQLNGEISLSQVVATGYGRKRVPMAQAAKPEIICHAKGVFHEFPFASTIIDIGGQDNKVIHLDEKGHVGHFRMNTKCAAGTGAFLEEIASKAKLPLSDLHRLALESDTTEPVNSFCTVFAMTEVLKKIMGGERLEDIARGIYLSIAERIRELYRRNDKALVVTGGVIEHNPILRDLLGETFAADLHIPSHPQFTGAMGAALFALQRLTVGDPQ